MGRKKPRTQTILEPNFTSSFENIKMNPRSKLYMTPREIKKLLEYRRIQYFLYNGRENSRLMIKQAPCLTHEDSRYSDRQARDYNHDLRSKYDHMEKSYLQIFDKFEKLYSPEDQRYYITLWTSLYDNAQYKRDKRH